ncbi:sensor histidine kinase [Desulfovibrio ferrophilus]|nr:ATP-binding protein [Desulfovibrio ferrophilus]
MDHSRILVAEDEAIIGKEIELTLKDLGYDVLGVVPTGEEAIERALSEQPDLVLMDIMLAGDIDGTEAAAQIRRQSHIPIIFSTAYTDDETLARVKPTAPYGYLIKPFDQTDLRITVETALYKSDMEEKLRVSEHRLRQAQKLEAVGTLASGIAHDFNNILSAIIGYSEMGLSKVDESDSLHKMLDRINKAGRRAKDLVQLMLDFSRPAGSDLDFVDLGAIVTEAMDMLSPSLPAGIRTDFSPPGTPCLVRASSTQMHQVALNLLKNAVDSMAQTDGTLSVTLESGIREDPEGVVCLPMFDRLVEPGWQDCACVKMVVRDTGGGMAEDVRRRAFDPFFTTKASGEGTGMGLAVVHGIVQSYGGWIGLESEPGRGSMFTVCLPQAGE